MVGTVGDSGCWLGGLVRVLCGAGLKRQAGQVLRVLESGLCPEGEVESLKDGKPRHALEGSSSSVSCL